MLRAIIIDDEEAGIETLKILAARNSARIKIVASALKAEDGAMLIATIQVTYGTAPGFTLLLPAEMRELYRVGVIQSRIDGRASYSKFRQFTVTTTEKPKGQ